MNAEPSSDNSLETDRQNVLGDFRSGQRIVEQAPPEAQRAYAIALATHWRFFLAIHQGPAQFSNLARAEQLHFYQTLRQLQHVHDRDSLSCLAIRMICTYILALIEGNTDVQVEAAQFLNHHARQGWAATCHSPAPRTRGSIFSILRTLLQKT